MEKSRKPKIRFKGYNDDWEQCKFRDIGSVSMCRRIFKEQTSLSGDVPFYKIGTFGAEPDAFISKKLFEEYKLKYPYPNKGDILISASGSIGKTVEYTGENEYFQDSNIVWLKHEDYIKNSFLKCYYSIVKWSGIEGSTIKRLYNENILNTSISVPSEMEQEQLGVFFENIELLITLHQRKLDKLINVKKSMLEKMFPKQGSTVPEIRFNGFTQAWEQRKLSGILCEKNERTSDFNSFPLYSLTIENGITPKTDRYERSSLVTKTEDLFKIVNQNEFVTNPMNLRFGALGYNKNPHYISVSGYYDVFSIDNDKCSAFWNSYFKTVSVMTVFDNAATGSLIEKRRVKYSTLKQISLLMPIELREKQKIGTLFEDIDELITLHQRKLEKLKNIKKSMLEKMFV